MKKSLIETATFADVIHEKCIEKIVVLDILPLMFSRLKMHFACSSLDYLQTDDKLLHTIDFVNYEAYTFKGFAVSG